VTTTAGINPEDANLGRWIFSAWKHLRAYPAGDAARFEMTALTGKAIDLLGRMRGLTVYSMAHLMPLAKDASITGPELRGILLPLLEGLSIVSVNRNASNAILGVQAILINEDDVMAQGARVWRALSPEGPERAALVSLRAVASLPRTRDEVLSACHGEGVAEAQARQGVELAIAHHLISEHHVADIGEDFLYNDFLWGEDIQRTTKALGALPTDVRGNLSSLLDELHKHEGRPLTEIESAPKDLVQMAVVHGLVERTEIVSTTGRTATFHFTPAFRGFGVTRDDVPDALDQVRLVMASFGFATRYARFKLDNPEVFLQTLIDRSVAGNASPIGTDYGALERQKIVEVEPSGRAGRFQFRAVKTDTLTQALDAMRAGALLRPALGASSAGGGGLLGHHFTDGVATRLRLGEQAGRTPAYDTALIIAVRDAAQRDKFT
jgi:hypothetical protein